METIKIVGSLIGITLCSLLLLAIALDWCKDKKRQRRRERA